jgi:hypothetical protein
LPFRVLPHAGIAMNVAHRQCADFLDGWMIAAGEDLS